MRLEEHRVCCAMLLGVGVSSDLFLIVSSDLSIFWTLQHNGTAICYKDLAK